MKEYKVQNRNVNGAWFNIDGYFYNIDSAKKESKKKKDMITFIRKIPMNGNMGF